LAAADAGERLFSGEVRFANGGPPCAACLMAAGLQFPGGNMGSDLTNTYSKYGPAPLETALTTLFFPTMAPVFIGRPLTPPERAGLVAFLAASDVSAPAPSAAATTRLFLSGLLVFAVLAVLTLLLLWFGTYPAPIVHLIRSAVGAML
jgi:hypothetical protein